MIAGEITISVADIDLIFVGLNVMVSSVETAQEVLRKRQMEHKAGMKLYVYCLVEDLDTSLTASPRHSGAQCGC